ncbi:MAG: PIG-L family deacetylase [Chloroflexia bacterium]|nr:PIG-L family deacetylase [Chloroflexia bacterium]
MDMATQRVMVIFAHPDDPEFMVGGTMAKWAREGAHICYVFITDGSAGSNDPTMPKADLIAIRQREQRGACDTAGVKDIVFMGYPDGELQPTLQLRRLLNKIRSRWSFGYERKSSILISSYNNRSRRRSTRRFHIIHK